MALKNSNSRKAYFAKMKAGVLTRKQSLPQNNERVGTPKKENVFISFHNKDRHAKELLKAQSKNKNINLQFSDQSVDKGDTISWSVNLGDTNFLDDGCEFICCFDVEYPITWS